MPRAIARCLAGSLILAGCSQAAPGDETLGRTESPIAYGTLDSTHTAVVALLSPVGSSELQECTGSVVDVGGGNGFVLTAAHCCNAHPPTIVVASSNYTVGEQYVFGGTPTAPAYAVIPGSVYYDALYTGADHDFCMLQFANAPANMATLALPSSASDGLALGSSIEHVGFGVTDTLSANSQRRSGTDTVDVELTPLVLEFSQGGSARTPGTCEGDSGGPSLLPAGAPQSQQVVVAVQSYGSDTSCAQVTLGGASRVSSEIGAGQFVTSYLEGTPTGVRASATPAPAPALGRLSIAELAVGLLGVEALLRRRRVGGSPRCAPS
jgi:hypothetical protein